VWLSIIFIPLFLVVAGCALFPGQVYDGFIWKYLAGPVAADAQNRPVNGITEGYNIVNTTVYAAILVVGLIGMYELFRRRSIDVLYTADFRLVLALLPYLALGGMWRSLEDAGLFGEPAAYLFIAPVIYITIAFVAGASMSGSIYIYKFSKKSYRTGMLFMAGVLACLNGFYAFLYASTGNEIYFLPHPAIFIALSAALAAAFYAFTYKKKSFHLATVFGLFGLIYFLFTVYILLRWTSMPRWNDHYFALTGMHSVATHIGEVLIITGIALVFTFIICAIPRIASGHSKKLTPFHTPVTALMAFSQFLDGAATFRGVSVYGYGEKHVVPSGLMGALGSPVVILVMKIVLVVAVVYLVDILYEEEMKKHPNAPIMVKTLVIILGLSPGIRDTCRIAMGV
jgi:uncharacterized membrane protein